MSKKSYIEIELDGKKHEFSCDPNTSILEAALNLNIDAPYSCMSGVCNSCQAHLAEGQVEMEICDALTEEEIRSGEILTCQAKPLSEKLKIIYK